MKIDLLKKNLQKLDIVTNLNIKNINELYIETTFDNLKNLIKILITEHKLNFIAEFCTETYNYETYDYESSDFIINILFSGRKQGYFVNVTYHTTEKLISLQDIIYPSYLFEREISDLFGLKIENGLDTRNLVKHELWNINEFPLRKNFPFGKKVTLLNNVPLYDFKPISGDGAFQIPVGPVHAGIIESGHFRFSVIGEPIENLEIRLMYKHRGIEKLCENVVPSKLNLVFERIAGESSASYAEAYALLVEKLLDYTVPFEIKSLRVIFLELERIYNFLDDIAGICADVGYSYPAKKFSYFSEQIHILCEKLTGSRFIRNVIVPCGINVEFTSIHKTLIYDTLFYLRDRIDEIVNSTLDSVTFLDRVEDTGIISKDLAKKFCMTGVSSRASGIAFDVRRKFPYEIYSELKEDLNVEEIGGVFERYKLKIKEINESVNFIGEALSYINVDIARTKQAISLPKNSEAIISVETVKGELVVYASTTEHNTFHRVYFKTPSFTNWNGLTSAVRGEIIPDFPLCNKSFNMSYSENDR